MTVIGNNLGNGLEEIKFFSKEIDYDQKLFEENQALKKKDVTHRSISEKDLLRIWEEGGPVKILCLPHSDVYPLYFNNYKNLDYDGLKNVLGKFLTIYELENRDVRVTYRNENDLRAGYEFLKQDKRYEVRIKLDVKEYQKTHHCEVKECNKKKTNNKKNKNLISKWLNNGNVTCEISKQNSFPIQINNYQNLRHDDLIKLFSKYGKFVSITNLGNGCVQVKYSNEDAAKECYKDLIDNRHYNVKLLFFLKELNINRKLVKDILPSDEEEHLSRLLLAEDGIKFCPNKFPHVNGNNKERKSITRKNCESSPKKLEDCEKGREFVVKKNHDCMYNHSNTIYVEGTPLHNAYLKPPNSYTIWKNKMMNLPPPSNISERTDEADLNYEYFLENMNGRGIRRRNLE